MTPREIELMTDFAEAIAARQAVRKPIEIQLQTMARFALYLAHHWEPKVKRETITLTHSKT